MTATVSVRGTGGGPAGGTARDRPAAVQVVGRRGGDVARRPVESLAVLAVFAVLYSLVGVHLVVHLHLVGFDTLDRLDRALMVWHGDPAELAAVGDDHPPLAVALLTPLTIVSSWARSLVVVPIASAVLAAAALVVVNTTMRRAAVAGPLRVVVLAGLGLNPLVVMYASLGSGTFLWLTLAVAGLGALFAWYVTADVRFVMLAGLAYAAAALTGYASLTWCVVGAVTIVAVLTRLGADGPEVEGTVVAFAAPTVIALTLWTGIDQVVLGRPFGWVTAGRDAGSSGLPHPATSEIVAATARIVLDGAPLAIVVLPALLVAGVARGNGFALWLGVLLGATVLTPGAAALLRLTDTAPLMADALPVLLVSVVGAAWLVRSSPTHGRLAAAALCVGLVVSVPWTFHAMAVDPHQGLERAFHDAVATGSSQEGALTPDGSTVGYADEREMADWVRAHVSGRGVVLTDDAQTYAVILLTGDPALFLDRVGASDGPWSAAAADPAAHVRYLLLSTDTSVDLLSRLYPDAAVGVDPLLTSVHADDRYQLVRVPTDYHYGDSAAATTGSPAGGATP